MKICIINPPLYNILGQDEEWSNLLPTIYRYFDVEYMRAYLKKYGISADIYDCIADNISLKMLKSELEGKKYEITLIFVYYYNKINFERLLNFLKKYPETFLVLGGDELELAADEYLFSDDFIKAVILGDKEKAFLNVLSNLRRGNQWKDSLGIAYRNKDIIVRNSLDYYSSLEEKPLMQHKFTMQGRSVALITSKGCYGECVFCAEKEIYSKYSKAIIQQRTVQQVIKEIERIEKKLSPRYIYICDANFMPSIQERKEWVQLFIHQLKKRKFHAYFSALLRINDVIYYEKIIPQLKEAGFTCLYVGIESFVQRQLDFYNKHTTVEENFHAIQIVLKSGMKINFTFLFLDPFTSIKEIRENLETVKKLNIYSYITYDQPFFSMTSTVNSIVGTKLHNIIKQNKLVLNDSKGYMFVDNEVTRYYEALREWNYILKKYDYIRFLVDKDWCLNEGEHYDKLCIIITQIRELDINCCIDLLHVYQDKNETSLLLNHYDKLMKRLL